MRVYVIALWAFLATPTALLSQSAAIVNLEAIENSLQKYQSGEIGGHNFTRQLLSTARNTPQANESIQILKKYQPHISEQPERARVTLSIARYYELLNDYTKALQHYQNYAQEMQDSPTEFYTTLVRIAHLRLELGQNIQASSLALRIAHGAPRSLRDPAVILLARVEVATGRAAQAAQRLKLFIKRAPSSPYVRSAYVQLYEIQSRVRDSAGATQTRAELIRRFPESIEAQLVQDNDGVNRAIIQFPSFTEIIEDYKVEGGGEEQEGTGKEKEGEEEESARLSNTTTPIKEEKEPATLTERTTEPLVAIQVGSFTKQENASKFQTRLQKEYRTVRVIPREINGNTYYQVRLYVVSSALDNALTKLQAESIESIVIQENQSDKES